MDFTVASKVKVLAVFGITLLTSRWPLLASQVSSPQAGFWGTINGKPIPDSVLKASAKLATDLFVLKNQREPSGPSDRAEIDASLQSLRCDRLKGAIAATARENVKQRLGVVVTNQDLEAARKASPARDPVMESSAITGRATAILNAFSAVYDRHQESDQVYEQILQHQIPKDLWLVYVHDAGTPEGRKSLEMLFRKQMTISPESLKKATSSFTPWRSLAETINWPARETAKAVCSSVLFSPSGTSATALISRSANSG